MAIINIKGVKIVSELYPVRLIPVFKDYLWGGTKLKDIYGYEIPSDHTGECWAISAHKNGDCTIADGEYKENIILVI